MSFTERQKAIYTALDEKAWKEVRICFDHERKLADQDIHHLFKLLSKRYHR